MKKNRVRSLLALGLSLTMMVSIMGCGKQQRLDAEINPDTPVSDVQFPLKETEELSFITSARPLQHRIQIKSDFPENGRTDKCSY